MDTVGEMRLNATVVHVVSVRCEKPYISYRPHLCWRLPWKKNGMHVICILPAIILGAEIRMLHACQHSCSQGAHSWNIQVEYIDVAWNVHKHAFLPPLGCFRCVSYMHIQWRQKIVEFRGAEARRRAALPCFSPASIELFIAMKSPDDSLLLSWVHSESLLSAWFRQIQLL